MVYNNDCIILVGMFFNKKVYENIFSFFYVVSVLFFF